MSLHTAKHAKHAKMSKTSSVTRTNLVNNHVVVVGVLLGIVVFIVVALMFWFNVLSGLAQSADFLYAQF